VRSPVAPVHSWPEQERRRYRELGLWTGETFADFVEDRTTRFAARTALVARDAHGTERRWTYRELAEQSATAAARLAAAAVEPGDRVVVALPNVAEYAATILGLFRLGALPVFALGTHREAELSHFCDVADAAALVLCGTDVDAVALHAKVAGRMTVAPPALVDVADWDLDA